MATAPKRNKPSFDPDDDKAEPVKNWPRFLVMESVDENNPLKKLSPFAVAKGIKGIAGEPKDVKFIRTGLLIEVTRQTHSDNLLKTTTFVTIPVRVTAHKSLNTRKGVIRCQELAGLDEEEIQNELASQHVVHVKRIYVDRGKKATHTYIMTFEATELPRSIKIGYINARVGVYVPNPLRCFKCQKYGHGSNRCTGKEICSKCAGEHSVENCTSDIFCCANCTTDNDHTASDRACPVYIKEKKVLLIKHTENISFPDARKIVESQTPSSPSYSSVVQADSKVAVTSVAVQTDLTWPRNQKNYSVIPATNNSSSQTTSQTSDQPSPCTSSTSESVKTSSEPRKGKAAINLNRRKGDFRRTSVPPKDSHISTSNRYNSLESMDTEEVHTSPAEARPTPSPITAPR